MTASSVEFFPCRVQLMGLPPTSTSISASIISTRPPTAKTKVCRNLFGTPDPGEMKSFYQQEEERNRSYVLQRYKINNNQIAKIPESQQSQLPTLIEKEFKQYAQRLYDVKHKPYKTCIDSTQTNISKSRSNVKITRSSKSTNSLLPAFEGQEPYSKQFMLTESFNIRKKRVCMKKSDQFCNPQKFPSKNSHRNLELLQIFKHSNTQQRVCNIQDEEKETATCTDSISQQHAEIKGNRNRSINCNNNCATLSLQLVVSTQNPS